MVWFDTLVNMVMPLFGDSYTQDSVHNSNVSGGVSMMEQKQKNAEDIELAVKSIERCIHNDNNFPELADKLKIRQGESCAISVFCCKFSIIKYFFFQV